MQVGAFALVGLMLAVIGVYGLLAFETARRTREIGIRSALGASRGEIVRGVMLDTARLATIGVALGFPAAIGVTGLLRGMLAPGSSANPLLYLLVASGTIVVALLASYGPARRASRVDPLIAMRAD
jgi:ABC-type antimicrobial peptide transport system permease subunit